MDSGLFGGYMKKLTGMLAVLITAMLIFPSVYAADEAALQDAATQDARAQESVIKTESESVFKGIFYKVWGRLRALSPSAARPAVQRTAVTAGIRGSETTTSLLQPYWKDDRTNDPEYTRELSEYTRAQQLAENGNLQDAIKALRDFIDAHGSSDLQPNAQFALGLSYGGAGDSTASIATLESFVKQHPKHPLVADAQQVIKELK
jgi:TolA-binding protein